MTLTEYFNIIQEKIKERDFTVLKIKTDAPKEISVFMEAINYFMWEWCDDHKDPRIGIFDYIIKPNDVDYDFTTVKFEDFVKFISETKSKEVIMVNTENLPIAEEKDWF